MKINDILKKEMEKDILICEKYPSADGSQELYGSLVTKYSVMDSDFSKNLSTMEKATALGVPFDYRQELKSIGNKLKMMLLMSAEEEINPIQNKIKELLGRGKIIRKEEYHPNGNGYVFENISGPKYDVWMSDINTINSRHLNNHPLHDCISVAFKQRGNGISVYNKMIGYLESLVNDTEYWESNSKNMDSEIKEGMMSNKVFIVHGHDTSAKETIARALEKAGFEAIILHEQADKGMTIIEKIESYTDVSFAVVLYTQCDLGRDKEKKEEDNRYRARQNVVFEHGYLMHKLGRDHVCAFVKGDVETPGDISGVIYTPMDDAGAWKMQLAKNMNAVGLEVNIYKMM